MLDDDTLERWLPIAGFEGRYEVSDFGRVRSLGRYIVRSNGLPKTMYGRLVAQTPNAKGYMAVKLTPPSGARLKQMFVHSLVLAAFVHPREDGMICCHNDGDLTNNHLTNLRWDSYSGNNFDRVKHGNHPATWRIKCPRGHALAEPNLVVSRSAQGHRNCLACSRGKARLSYWRAKGVEMPSLQEISDAYYAALFTAD